MPKSMNTAKPDRRQIRILREKAQRTADARDLGISRASSWRDIAMTELDVVKEEIVMTDRAQYEDGIEWWIETEEKYRLQHLDDGWYDPFELDSHDRDFCEPLSDY
jgi:hypothetical protein